VVIPHQTEGTFEIEDYGKSCYLYECIAPLRALFMQKTAPAKFKKIMSLESHMGKRRGTEAWENCQEKIIAVAKRTLGVMVFEALYPSLNLSDELIQRISGIFDTNAIEIRMTQSEAMALYETACLLEHSCAPNMRMSFDKNFNVTVRASCDLKAGDHLSIMYTHSLWATWARRDHLANIKHFWCTCERCKDPCELGTNFSTVTGKNGVSLTCRNPLDQSSSWVGKDPESGEEVSIEAAVVQDDMARIGTELAMLQMKGIVEEYEAFLEKYSLILHPNHFHMVTAKHSLCQMLGRTEGCLIQDMPLEMLKRKESLCRELVDIFKKLDPNAVRLQIYTAVALYELHLPLLQYGKRAWETGELPTEEFRESLFEPRKLLLEAMDMLKDETHDNLPEGQLRLQVKETLSQLEGFMKTVGCENF